MRDAQRGVETQPAKNRRQRYESLGAQDADDWLTLFLASSHDPVRQFSSCMRLGAITKLFLPSAITRDSTVASDGHCYAALGEIFIPRDLASIASPSDTIDMKSMKYT